MKKRGVSFLEMLSMEMKGEGYYVARGLSFKEAVNSGLRRALGSPDPRADYAFPTFDLGAPSVDTVHALRLASDLEDEETAREMSVGR